MSDDQRSSKSPTSAVRSTALPSAATRDSEALIKSCQYGHREVAKLLLECGADLTAQNNEALTLACRDGHLEIVQLLLEYGADPSAGNNKPMLAAMESGHIEIVQLLLSHGASPHFLKAARRNHRGEILVLLVHHGAKSDELLHTEGFFRSLAEKGDCETIGELLNCGFALNPQDVINAATGNGHYQIIDLMFKRGLGIDLRSGNDKISTDGPVMDGYYKTIELLLNHGMHPGRFTKYIKQAVIEGRYKTTELLLKYETREQIRTKCMVEAANMVGSEKERRASLVKLLINHGAANDQERNNKALKGLVFSEQYEMINLLLSYINPESYNQELLEYAVEWANYDVVRLLLERMPHCQFSLNKALDKAVLHGWLDATRLLLNSEANCVSSHLLYRSVEEDRFELLKLLLCRLKGFKKQKLLSAAIESKSIKTIKVLLEHGADVDPSCKLSRKVCNKIAKICLRCNARVRNSQGLKVAAMGADKKLLQRLMEKPGANVRVKHDEPLRVAAKHGSLQAVEILLNYGANVHAKQEEALRNASERGFAKVVKLLLQYGAKIEARNYEALKSAIKSRSHETVKILYQNTKISSKLRDELIIKAAWCHDQKTLEFLQNHL